ncbi:MAG: ankyrin repeat domain-containing protein [Bacteroidota bacterium]
MPIDIYHSLSRDVLSYSTIQQELLSLSPRTKICTSPAASSLRKVLREYLPSAFVVGDGYICVANQKPVYQDVIIIEKNQTPLYSEGDFLCVRPEDAKAIVGVLSNQENRYGDWMNTCSRIGHEMKKAGNAQGLVAYWVESEDISNRGIGFEYWKNAIAERNIPSFVAWGDEHCFCKHIGLEPALYQWKSYQHAGSKASPAIASLLSLICYHLLETTKSAPFREWFAEKEWRKESISELLSKQGEHGRHSTYEHHARNGHTHLRDQKKSPTPSRIGGTQAVADRPQVIERPRKKHKKSLRKNRRKKSSAHLEGINSQMRKQKIQDSSNTPVHQAVLSLDTYALERCHELRLDINGKNKEGNSPLHLAAEFNLVEMTIAIIEYEADLNVRNYLYATPLHTAIETGCNEVVEVLLEAGAEVEARNNRARTPLHQAAICGNREAVNLLLDSFADIHARMEKDMQPLHLACWYGQTEIVDLLIEKGADKNAVNADGNTALHFAAFNGQVKVIKQLINYQADPTILNYAGETYTKRINEGYSGEVIRVLE